MEQAFRSLKGIDLKVRPFYHDLDVRGKEHVFLCMLAYYAEWHMRHSLAAILFDDDDREAGEALRHSVVAPAQRSPQARHKAQTKRTAQGEPVHSFQTPLLDLATIAKNAIVFKTGGPDSQEEEPTFQRNTTPTPFQQRAFQPFDVALNWPEQPPAPAMNHIHKSPELWTEEGMEPARAQGMSRACHLCHPPVRPCLTSPHRGQALFASVSHLVSRNALTCSVSNSRSEHRLLSCAGFLLLPYAAGASGMDMPEHVEATPGQVGWGSASPYEPMTGVASPSLTSPAVNTCANCLEEKRCPVSFHFPPTSRRYLTRLRGSMSTCRLA